MMKSRKNGPKIKVRNGLRTDTGRVKVDRVAVSASVCFYGDGSKGPTRHVSWDTTRLCWSREICMGNAPFFAIFGSFYSDSLH